MRMIESDLKLFRHEFAAKMESLEKRFNIKINLGNISYNDAGFTSKISVKRIDIDTGTVMIDPNAEKKARLHLSIHLKDANICMGPIFGEKWKTICGNIITITDWKSKNSRFPVIYEHDGKTYKGQVNLITGRA